MKKDGKGFSVTVWSAVALGAVGIGVVVAFLAGYFLGHFTGHEKTTTVSAVTSPAEGGEGASTEEEAGEEETTPEAAGEEEVTPEEQPEEPEEGGEAEEGGEEAGASAGGDAAAGQEVFADNCSVCHGPTGHGGAGGPDLRQMPKAKSEAATIEQVMKGGGGMPSFEGQLSETEIEDVAAFVVEKVVGGG